jgi:hypothetical protein
MLAIPGEDPIILIFAPPVTYSADGNQTRASAVNQPDVWLRSISSNAGSTTWAFSPDGKAFTAAGEKYKFEWASYRGDRIGIFSYTIRLMPVLWTWTNSSTFSTGGTPSTNRSIVVPVPHRLLRIPRRVRKGPRFRNAFGGSINGYLGAIWDFREVACGRSPRGSASKERILIRRWALL